MAEKKPVCEITIEAADIPDHALIQLPVILRECQRIMGEHGYNHAYLGRGNIGKWSLSLVREIRQPDNFGHVEHRTNVDKVFYILVTEQPKFIVESFDRKVLESDDDEAVQQVADMP